MTAHAQRFRVTSQAFETVRASDDRATRLPSHSELASSRRFSTNRVAHLGGIGRRHFAAVRPQDVDAFDRLP